MGQTLAELFQDVVTRFPDRVAVTAPDGDLTYTALDNRADALAEELTRRGIRPGDLVTLIAPRSLDLVIGILGIVKAGAAYLPIDPAYPPARVAWTVQDSGSTLVVATQATTPALADLPESTPTVLSDTLHTNAYANANSNNNPTPADPAYVIYTSGSTGDPKGVQVEHHSVGRLFEVTRDLFDLDENDVWTVFHSAAFDFSVWEIWGALLHGARLVIVSAATVHSPERFRELLRQEKVTILNQTPSAFRRLIAADAHAPTPLSDLRLVIFGGERLDLATLRPWVERYGVTRPRLVNMYGITEATVHASYHPITQGDLEADTPSPIGRPLPDLTFHVLDEHGHPANPGELHIEGPGLARGYLGRPRLTSQRFPTIDTDKGRRRLLRTGDRVAALPDGGYGYLGRVDDQLKIRGYRIEPGEIEAVLAGVPDVSQAVVIPQDHGDDDVRLIAYIASLMPESLIAPALRNRATAVLPPHMRPSAYIVLDDLPLTRNGKVDKAKLANARSPRQDRS